MVLKQKPKVFNLLFICVSVILCYFSLFHVVLLLLLHFLLVYYYIVMSYNMYYSRGSSVFFYLLFFLVTSRSCSLWKHNIKMMKRIDMYYIYYALKNHVYNLWDFLVVNLMEKSKKKKYYLSFFYREQENWNFEKNK